MKDALLFLICSGLSAGFAFFIGLHYSEGYTKRALRRSWERERRLQNELARTMDAYNKVVAMYNRDINRDDSKDADWWRNCDP